MEKADLETTILFNKIKDYLKKQSLPYELGKSPFKLTATYNCGPDQLSVKVELLPLGSVLFVYMTLPLKFYPEQIPMMARAVNYINRRLKNGYFNLDIGTGNISFNITQSYCESIISDEAIEDIFLFFLRTAKMFTVKFLLIAESGNTNLKQIIRFLNV